eukprot:Ihof_evm1s404 gene=Ihof_evmTU1s404
MAGNVVVPTHTTDRYWCHNCQRETEVDMMQYACSVCRGGFIELMNEDFHATLSDAQEPQSTLPQTQSTMPTFSSSPMNGLDEEGFDLHNINTTDDLSYLLNGILEQMQAHHQHPQPHNVWIQRPVSLRDMVGRGNTTTLNLGNSPEGVISFPGTGTINFGGGRMPTFPGALFSGPTIILPRGAIIGGGGGEDPAATGLANFMNMIARFGTPAGATGNMGDYAWGPDGLDNIISRLMDQLQGGAPPAPLSVIESLPTIRITKDYLGGEKKECTVCMEVWKEDEEARKLPCEHIFHQDCIVPWLKA